MLTSTAATATAATTAAGTTAAAATSPDVDYCATTTTTILFFYIFSFSLCGLRLILGGVAWLTTSTTWYVE